MTSLSSITPNPASQTPTNASAPSSSAPSRTPSSSGQTSSSAAVSANAPAQRQAPSYANVASVVTSKKPPTGPATSSNSVSPAPSAPAQHARSSSTATAPVNGGRIQPAVPNIQNSGNAPNGASGIPLSGGQHSRNPSVAGAMPNGTSRSTNIKFGFSDSGPGPTSSTSAPAAGTNLTAPVAPNPRANSPLSSPSPAPQPVASGGAPQQASTRQIQFGDHTTPSSPRQTPLPPAGPGGMVPQGHSRRDSTHSAHGEHAPNMPHGRGMPAGRGRNQPYNNNYQNQQYGGYGRGGFPTGPNQPRNGPNNMGGPGAYHNQQFNANSPRTIPRSPAMAHASPSMAHAVPTPTPQLYQAAPQFVPNAPHGYPTSGPMGYEHYHYQQYTMPYPQQPFPQTSPRPGYVAPQMQGGYMPQYGQPHAPSMSRSSSTNIGDMHPRPASGMGHHPTPSPMTPQPASLVSPPAPGTPVQVPASPYSTPVQNRPKRAFSKAIVIKDPSTGAPIPVEPKVAPVAPAPASSPVVVSTPSSTTPSTADSEHTRSGSTSHTKTAEEKRKEMRDGVLRRMQEAKRLEEEEKKKQQQAAEQDDSKRKADELAAEEEKKKAAEEEAAKKAAEEKAKAEAEEKAKKEAEEKAKAEAEEKAKAEAEAKAKAEAEEKAKKEAEEKAKAEAEEKAKKEAEEKAQKEAEEKAKTEAEERAKAEAEAKAAKEKEEAEKAKSEEAEKPAETKAEGEPAATPEGSKDTPDNESMPPPPLRAAAEKAKMKPSPLNLQLKTNEPAPPSAALTSLMSARPIDNIRKMEYPEGIQSPNPALNPMASSKFKYDKDFLLQFQNVFTEKPTTDWDQKIRETVGDTDSGRSSSSRTPLSGMAPRQSSRSGSGMPPMGGMGSFGSFASGKPGGMGFGGSKPSSSGAANPLAGYFSRPGGGLPRTGSTTSLSGSGQNAMGSRVGNRSARGSSKRGAGGAAMERQESQKGGPTIPLDQVKPLEVSATRWKPISIGKKPAEASAPPVAPDQPMMAPEMVQRKVKAALNKMTPEKFDKISDQILEITSQSRFENDGRTLRQVIQLTFEKATDEAAWSSMYAKFCKRMLESIDPNIKDESIRDRYENVVTGGNLFRKYLLNRCQEEFEKGWKVNLPPKPEGVSDEAAMLSDEYYIAAAAKRRGLGLVQFIGELFKLGMLTERIMNECVRKTLDFEGIPEDETVESLAKLLRTIGAQLDASDKSRPLMDAYFERIDSIIQNKELNSRMRFMLMDVVDLRKKGWESKEADKGPKTIAEIREEAMKAQAEKEAASRANRSSRPPAGRGDARSFSGQGFGHQPDRSGGQVNMDDLRKLRSSRQASSNQGSFGPSSMLGGRSSSGSGSRRGGIGPGASRDDSGPNSRTATPPAPQATAHANSFSALSALAGHHDDGNDNNDAASPPASNAGSPQVTNAQLERVRSSASTEDAK